MPSLLYETINVSYYPVLCGNHIMVVSVLLVFPLRLYDYVDRLLGYIGSSGGS